MRNIRFIFLTLLLAATVSSASAQGFGFVLGGEKVELKEGDKVNFTNVAGNTVVTVTKDGKVTVHMGNEMTFYGDAEQYFLDAHKVLNKTIFDDENTHAEFGYGAVMHIRDLLTNDMFVYDSPYGWHFSSWARNAVYGNSYYAQIVWRYYENAIAASNALVKSIDEQTATEIQREYLGVGYAFRAMHYLDLARMYEYLPCDATLPRSNTGKDILGLTVPIITENTTDEDLATLGRATRQEMFGFIQSDLQKAESLLASYQRTSKRLPDLACVYGLQARLHLWVEDYAEAARYARLAIERSGAVPLSESEMLDTENGFNTMEPSSWMWGSQPYPTDRVVTSGIINWPSWMCNEVTFGYTSAGPFVSIVPSLYNMMGTADVRRKLFNVSGDEPRLPSGNDIPAYASLKFRPYQGNCTDYKVAALAAYPLMRVEEMYLIEAEAKAHQSLSEGANLLCTFVTRYRDPQYSLDLDSLSESRLVDEVFTQKRIELWGEGLSFFDYKRLDKPVDRTQYPDANYVASREQFRTTTRPAWMNMVFVTRNGMNRRWATVGEENPEYKDLYSAGGGIATSSNSYSVDFVDGIMCELFPSDTPRERISISAEPLDSVEGIRLLAPFSSVCDSTMGYRGTPLEIRLAGGTASIPFQPLGIQIGGEDAWVYSTKDGILSDGMISFPRNGIAVSHGNDVTVVNSNAITEVYLPGNGIRTYLYVYLNFYPGKYQATVHNVDSMQYLRTYLSEMTNLDEARLVCVPNAQRDEAIARLKTDPAYGVAVRDTGWVDIPMYINNNVEEEFRVAYVGMKNGVVYHVGSSQYGGQFPDYSVSLYNYSVKQMQDATGVDVAYVEYCFGPHVDKAYLALVDKYATEEEIRQMYKSNALPSMILAELSHSYEVRAAQIPFPAEYGEYKVVALALADNKLVKVSCGDDYDESEVTVLEHPIRNLSAAMSERTFNDDGSVSVSFSYEADEFDHAYVAFVCDSMLTGNLRQDVLGAAAKLKVTGSGTASMRISNPIPGAYYTMAIVGCDSKGKALKDVRCDHLVLTSPWTRWFSTKAEWVNAGMDADAWPLSDNSSTCTYTYTNIWSGTDSGLPIEYRQSYADKSAGQFKIRNWGYGTELIIEYDSQTGACQLLPQYVGEISNYGSLYIADVPHYSSNYTYEQFPCTYDRSTGKFVLTTIWYVSAGIFGYNPEYVQVDGFYIPDYSIEAMLCGTQTDEMQNAYANLNVTSLGVDVEYAKAVVVANYVDATAVADSIAAGAMGATDLVVGQNLIGIGNLSGNLKVVAVSMADGKVRQVETYAFEYYGGNANPWKTLGKALYTDDIIVTWFSPDGNTSFPPETYEVEIQENRDTPGLYRLVDPYGPKVHPYYEALVGIGVSMPSSGKYLVINACDSAGVYVEHQGLGIDWGEGEVGFVSEGARYIDSYPFETIKQAGRFGKLENGVITFPSFEINQGDYYQGILSLNGSLTYYCGMNRSISITLPYAVRPAARKKARESLDNASTLALRKNNLPKVGTEKHIKPILIPLEMK